ncbi:hypothetical protein ACFY0G_45295 [Streptomyces sp. NPDC001552]|uniref:hypothetical protein n=1 Tax=Streptomyces sp. NPDC001552 TaxID=3364587 RepID=UPI0036A9E186
MTPAAATARNRYSVGAAAADVTEIRTAIAFSTWLDSHQTSLADADQPLFERWMTEHRTRVRQLTSFIRWTTARGLNTALTAPKRPRQFAGSCLTDSTLPRQVRIMGALVLLQALPLSRISELTTTQFRRTPERAFLTLARHPVLVPPGLTPLIEDRWKTLAPDTSAASSTTRRTTCCPARRRPVHATPSAPAPSYAHTASPFSPHAIPQ